MLSSSSSSEVSLDVGLLSPLRLALFVLASDIVCCLLWGALCERHRTRVRMRKWEVAGRRWRSASVEKAVWADRGGGGSSTSGLWSYLMFFFRGLQSTKNWGRGKGLTSRVRHDPSTRSVRRARRGNGKRENVFGCRQRRLFVELLIMKR